MVTSAQSVHRHDEPTGQSLVSAARAALIQAGEQWTAMRSVVFEALAEHDRPVSAYEIADRVSDRRGKRVAANSVYRILDLFVRANIANPHPGCRHDCIFLICDSCGLLAHCDDDALAGALLSVGLEQGFRAVRPVVEVRGVCAACSRAV